MATTPTLEHFFKGSDTKFGIFYPVHYMVAIFSDSASAHNAERALGFHGFLDEDVITVPGTEVIRFADEHLKHTSLWGALMQQLSRMFATEEIYISEDLKLAEQGCPFMAVYCPHEKNRQEAWELIEPFGPIRARLYALDGVQHFKGEL